MSRLRGERINTSYVAESSRDEWKYAGRAVGWIRRAGVAKSEAIKKARGMPWWSDSLVLDSRDLKWFVFREPSKGVRYTHAKSFEDFEKGE